MGSTGDDRYDPGPEVASLAGPSSYSDPPTPAEVNAGSYMNQIVAECNRRRLGTNGPTDYWINSFQAMMAYKAAADLFTVSGGPLTIRNAVNSIRQNERRSAFSFTFSGLAGVKLERQAILELRKALATDYYNWPFNRPIQTLQRRNSFYPPTTTTVQSPLGRTGQTGIGDYFKYRHYLFATFPSWMPSIGAANFVATGFRTGLAVDWTYRLYRANADLSPIDTGDWGNLDNLDASALASAVFPNGASNSNVSLALSAGLAAIAPGNVSYIAVSSRDEANTNPGAGGTSNEYSALTSTPSDGAGALFLELYTA